LDRNQDSVLEWSDMSISGLLLQWAIASTKTNPNKRVSLVQS